MSRAWPREVAQPGGDAAAPGWRLVDQRRALGLLGQAIQLGLIHVALAEEGDADHAAQLTAGTVDWDGHRRVGVRPRARRGARRRSGPS